MTVTIERRVVVVEKQKVEKIQEDKTELNKATDDIIWGRIIVLFLLHASAIYGAYFYRSEISFNTAIFLKVYIIFTGLGISLGHHRLWTHKAYKATNALQILLAIAASGTIQWSIYDWAKDHRMHHKYSETDGDPHNPSRGFFFSHIGWLFVKKHKEVREKGKLMDYSDLENNPIVMFQHKYYPVFVGIFFIFLPIFIPCYFWGESLEHAVFICVLYKLMLNLHVIWSINSFAHSSRFGYKTYNSNIGPTDNPMGWVTSLGEGYHNFHHVFPWDYRSGEFSSDSRNISALLIDMFHKFGMAYDLRAAPRPVVEVWMKEHGDHNKEADTYLDKFFSKETQHSIIQLKYVIFQLILLYLV